MKSFFVSNRWVETAISVIVLTISVMLNGCQFMTRQSIPKLTEQSAIVQVPEFDYSFAAWVDHDWLVFVHHHNTSDKLLEHLLAVNMLTGEATPVHFELPKECTAGHIFGIRRLTIGQAAFLFECFHAEPGKFFEDSIFIWDRTSQKFNLLRHYPPKFRASDFAFSPDLSAGLQERSGDGIYNRLYTVDGEGTLTEVFLNYYRVGVPDWAADGNTVAFAGTPKTPEKKSSLFTGLVEIDNALGQPWTIYTATATLAEQTAILENLQGVRDLRFSPDGTKLAFNAQDYHGWEGVFVISLQTKEVTQIWQQDTEFDWSPDGNQMLIMRKDKMQNGETRRMPVILNVSALYNQ